MFVASNNNGRKNRRENNRFCTHFLKNHIAWRRGILPLPAATSDKNAPAMIQEFVKKRWFSLALLLLLLAAILRKNIRFQSDDVSRPPATETREKYTDASSAPKATALLNVGGDGVATVRFPGVDEATTVAFLKRFAQVAVTEQEKFGMPASVLLAAAYVNSFGGGRACAVQANNYLATRCSAGWNGPEANISGTCFRQYETAWESIRDFGAVHSRKDWYKTLKQDTKDWKKWVQALVAHRVSDVENAEAEMVRVIEEYRLFELDGE